MKATQKLDLSSRIALESGNFTVNRLYDSHVHLLSTGQMATNLDLTQIQNENDILLQAPLKEHFRGDWLLGFGWDENKWQKIGLPNRWSLDKAFPGIPVVFTRADGHASWMSTTALQKIGYIRSNSNGVEESTFDPAFKIHISTDEQGLPTGIVKESAHQKVFEFLPPLSRSQVRSSLLSAIENFNQAGFTHVRDMSHTLEQWQILTELEDEGLLSLYVEALFTAENVDEIGRTIEAARVAALTESSLRKVRGIKIYFDGSLGSETALLSKPYAHRSDGWRGLTCWSAEDVEQAMTQVWKAGMELSVHTIGDEAADIIVSIARKISSQKISGRLNLEHVELLQNKTIEKMKSLHICCHLQPCHWLSDRVWLKERLGSLYQTSFQWEALRLAKVPFYFGSDSPIEKPSLKNNIQALLKSKEFGIPALNADPLLFHSHPGGVKVVDSSSRFENWKLVDCFFQKKRLEGHFET